MGAATRTFTWREAAFFLPLAILVALFWFPAQIYLQDLSDWTYQGWLFAKYLSGDAITQYALKPYPVPNSLITVLLGLLGLIMPILCAEKMLVSLALLGWGALIYRMSVKDGVFDLAYALLCFTLLALASNFWNGYLNFNISGLLWCLFLYLESDGRSSAAKILLFSVAIFFSHAATYALFVGYIVCRYSLRSALWLIPSLALLLGYIAGRYLLGGNAENIVLVDPINGAGAAKWFFYKVYTVLKLGFFQNYLFEDGQSFLESHARSYWILVLLSSVMLAALLLQIASIQMGRWGLLSGREKLFLLGAPVALLALPSELFGVVNPAERVLFLYLIYGLMYWQWPATIGRYLKRAAGVVALVFVCYNAIVLVSVNAMHIHEMGIRGEIANPNSVYGFTKLPYFSHKLFTHGEKLDSIKAGRQDAVVFSSGIWMNKNNE